MTWRCSLLVAGLLLGGCGHGSGAAAPTTTLPTFPPPWATSSTEVADTSSTTTTTVPGYHDRTLGVLRHHASWTDVTSDGYRTQGLIRWDEPQKLDRVADAFRGKAGACDVDPLTDALVPALLTFTNETPNFPQKVSGHFSPAALTWPGRAAVLVQIAGEVECHRAGDDPNGLPIEVESAKPVGLGGNISVAVYFILHGYFTPNHPEGDRDELAQAKVEMVFQGDGQVVGDGAYNDDSGQGVGLSAVARAPQ